MRPSPKPVASGPPAEPTSAVVTGVAERVVPRAEPAGGSGGDERVRATEAALPPGERVARRLERFVGERREWVTVLARQLGVEVPAEVTRWFELLQGGQMDEARVLYHELAGQRQAGESAGVMNALFPAIEEAFGAVEISRKWAAPDLVAFGEAVLGSLRPGMVYVSGSEAGRFIPALLDEGTGEERRVVVSPHHLSDPRYMEYLSLVSGGRLIPLTAEDSQKAFVDYLNDAKARALHDRKSPEEPPQLRPGEEVVVDDFGRVQVNGSATVAAIAELQLKALVAKNAGLGFAMEEVSALPYLRGDASPSGPVWELRSGAGGEGGSEVSARAVAEYWQTASERVLGGLTGTDNAEGGTSAGTRAARDAWARLAAAQGGLLAEQNQAAAAEEVLQLAARLAVAEAGPVMRYAEFLDRAGRRAELEPFLADYARQGADQRAVVESVRTQLQLPASPEP